MYGIPTSFNQWVNPFTLIVKVLDLHDRGSGISMQRQ